MLLAVLAVLSAVLAAAIRHTVNAETLPPRTRERLAHRHHIVSDDFEPRVYRRLTDNWLELTVRLMTRDHGIRSVKDGMSREVLAGLDAAGIMLASTSLEVTTLPAPPPGPAP